MNVQLGPYPLCDPCRQVNGGLVSTQHRQVHVRAYGKESCVDEHLAGLVVGLWEVCDTRSSCQDHNGRAYVTPTPETADAAERFLTDLGLPVEREDGALCFPLPAPRPAPEPLPRQPAAPAAADGDLLFALHRVRQRVAAAAGDLSAATVGVDHPRVAGARLNLQAAESSLTASMRRYVSPVRRPADRVLRAPFRLLLLGVLVLATGLAAMVAGAVTGRSPVWMTVAALAGYGLVTVPVIRMTGGLDERLSRSRLARALAGAPAALPAPGPPHRMLALICTELLHVQYQVDLVRRDLAGLAYRRLRSHPRRPPDSPAGLAWATRRDLVLADLVDAEVMLITAADNLGIWLSLSRG